MAGSCTGKEGKEEFYAVRMVNTARVLMARGDYTAAKDSILTMRKTFPTAFQARAAGIVVMDSIELLMAQESLAAAGSALKKARKTLELLEAEKRKGYDADYYRQRTDVFHLQQRFDETEAKVKFYLRKIEVDIHETDRGFGHTEADGLDL